MTLADLKKQGEAPEFLTAEAFDTLSKGYLLAGETPKDAYKRVSRSVAKHLKKPELEKKFFDYIWKNWLCLASPVVSNCGSERGLPISCFGQSVNDSLSDIFMSYHESAMLSKYGGGIGKYWGDVRGRGEVITGNGFSEGVIPWLKNEDTNISSVSQGGVRRGASANYLPIWHPDADEFLDVRRQTGDDSRRCRSTQFHHGLVVSDDFMKKVETGDPGARKLWSKTLKTRTEMGEPYLMFSDNANNQAPQWYKDKGLTIKTSQLCNEIFLFNDKDHTFVCCLSSLNLARYDEWKDSDLVQTSIWFLDGVMEEFISKAKTIKGFEKAVRFSEKSRALGLGVLGWHTLLQNKNIPFDSFDAMMLNKEIFSKMQTRSLEATKDLALEYGEPEWCKGYGIRNTHCLAVAPTMSNALISGGVSQGVEPIVANVYAQKTAKGTYLRKNPALDALLTSKNMNNLDVWNKINSDRGSVKNLDFLSAEEKDTFKTAREINQFAIIRQAAQRQRFIDQGQSINLFFTVPENINDSETKKKLGKYIHQVHFEAWQSGLKGLYYLRNESPLRGDAIYQDSSDCKACEG